MRFLLAFPATAASLLTVPRPVGAAMPLPLDAGPAGSWPWLVLVLALSLSVALAVALTIRWRAGRERRRASVLATAAERLAAGDLTAAIPQSPSGPREPLEVALESLRSSLADATGAREYLEQVIRSISDAIILTRADGVIARVNPAAEKLLRLDAAALCGRPVSSFIADSQLPGFSLAESRSRTLETIMVTGAGEQVPVSYACSAIGTDDPSLRGFVITARNITERKIAEQRIRYLARIDALTKVPNRMQFQHLLQRAIARARRGRHHLALVYLDIDKFKEINDTFGHTAGDLCLETLTDRLTRILPDSAVVGRLAGDEFGVIIDNLDPERNLRAEVVATTRMLQQLINEPLHFQGHTLYMSASAGIALYPGDGSNVIDLIRNADAAMYRAKRQGGGALDVYHPDMNAAAVDRLMLKSRLRKAFEHDELLVYYQPKIDLRDGSIAGAEALVRWNMPDRGIVLPAEFIPLAEESNLILDIGEWVLDRVCRDLRDWLAVGMTPPRISVNLSLRQLKQRNFTARVREIVEQHDIPTEKVELEITETTLMEDPTRTIRILDDLYRMGLRLAIDDFGTGYSSLSALQQFPIGTLKIDQSFVRNTTTDHDQATIVAMVIEMGHSLQMDVVAEGVESEDQLRFLRALNCDFGQGLLFGKPMTAGDFQALLSDEASGGGPYDPLFARG